MYVYKIAVNEKGETNKLANDYALVIAETSQVARDVLRANGIVPFKHQGGYLMGAIPSWAVKKSDTILLSEKARNSTTMYKNIADATGLKYSTAGKTQITNTLLI
jgi:hypothetical protein